MITPADETRHPRGGLRLVRDRGRVVGKEEVSCNERMAQVQLELFGRSDAMIFVEARGLDVQRLRGLLHRYQVRHVLDLRDVPYLNFGRRDRNSFFSALQESDVDYQSLHAHAVSRHKGTIGSLLEDEAAGDELERQLREWVGSGPTLVFTTRNRESDPTVHSLSALLGRARIHYSELLEG